MTKIAIHGIVLRFEEYDMEPDGLWSQKSKNRNEDGCGAETFLSLTTHRQAVLPDVTAA